MRLLVRGSCFSLSTMLSSVWHEAGDCGIWKTSSIANCVDLPIMKYSKHLCSNGVSLAPEIYLGGYCNL